MAVLTDNKTWEIELSKVVARTWVDAEFRDRLIDAPTATLKKAGLDFGDVVEVRVTEDKIDSGFNAVADGKMIFVLPLPPKPADLADEKINTWLETKSICKNSGQNTSASCT